MNSNQSAKPGWVKVVVWIIVCLAVLLLALVIGVYYAIMHTSLPFKFVEAMLSSGNGSQNLKVEGISGSIAKGFVIQRISWTDKDGESSEIRDVKVLYSGFWDLMGGKKVLFKEIHIGKAHLDVTGIEEFASDMNGTSHNGANDDDEPDLSAFTNSPAFTNNPAWQRRSVRRRTGSGGPQLFQIDRIGVADVFITNRTTGFGLSIPAVDWKGFKAENGKVELGELTVDSDRLKVETHAGESATVNGETIAFQKKLEGTILPTLHKSILKPIVFTIDAVYSGGALVWRLKAFDGKMEAYRGSDHSGFMRCKNVDLAGYFDAAVPQHLTAEANISRKNEKEVVKVGKGAFQLGNNWFEIQPAEWEQADNETRTNTIDAISHAGKTLLKYQLVQEPPWKIEQRLTAQPEMKPEEILASIYFGKKSGELSADQQKTLGNRKGSFGGWTNEVEASQVASAKPASSSSKPKPKTQPPQPEAEAAK